MTHTSVFPGKCEIVEIEDEFSPGENYRRGNFPMSEVREERDRRSLASSAENVSCLDEELNQLFEIFNRRASPHGSSRQNQAGTSKRNSSKRSVKSGGSHSPGYGISERVNLKQALRGLCISQASEMAAMKRSMKSPRTSQAEMILTMYRNVVVDDVISDNSHDDSGERMLEITPVPEQTTSDSFMSIPEKHARRTSSLSPAARTSIGQVSKSGTRENGQSSASIDSASQTFWTQSSQMGTHASPTSSSHSSYVKNTSEIAEKLPAVKAGKHNSAVDMLHQDEKAHSPCCSDASYDKLREHNMSTLGENMTEPLGENIAEPLGENMTEPLHDERLEPLCSSRSSCGETSSDIGRKIAEQKHKISPSPVFRNQERLDTLSPRSDVGDKVVDHSKNSSSTNKMVNKEAAAAKLEVKELAKDARESLKIIPTGSPKGKKVSRSKPLIKTKNFVKRRSKKKAGSDNSSKSVCSELNSDMYSSPNPIVCPRCQCMVTGSSLSRTDSPISSQDSLVSNQESMVFYQDSPISPFASLSGEVSSGNAISDISTPGPSSDGSNKFKTESCSPGECSSNISINLGRPSFCDRPHMSKDIRWEAVRHAKFQYGTLGLKNFSLLKKLGCGDIGTVYLTELIGTNCLFAIKVMDNEFLARRKKITRAQTEKEILRMLDHPFLPTLYCQFTSDNLSCLVMEYCPGGDLHVLRQKQPGRCFTEEAARFYVAEVLLALEYLHMLGVVYRDLKPENILVREDGHIMLSDFDLSLRCAVSPTLLVSSSMSEGSRKNSRDSHRCSDSRCAQPLCIEPSCQVSCFTPRHLVSSSKSRKMKSDIAAEMRPLLQLVAEPTTARSNSFVGTHEYLAPEIIKGEGHGSAVDWWTYGVFLYELLYGRTPFKGAGNEETLANVILQSLKFPDSPLVSLEARELIAALLVKEPDHRLGTEKGATEIKQHPFFDGLNWALIRCNVPPELPESHNYEIANENSNEKNNKNAEHSSGSGSAEHLEFEVF